LFALSAIKKGTVCWMFCCSFVFSFLVKERLKYSKKRTPNTYGICFSRARRSEPHMLCRTKGCVLRIVLVLGGIFCYKIRSGRWRECEKTHLYAHVLSQHSLTSEESTTWYHYVRFSLPSSQTCFPSKMLVNHRYSAGYHKSRDLSLCVSLLSEIYHSLSPTK
jgi:hypothetical protein